MRRNWPNALFLFNVCAAWAAPSRITTDVAPSTLNKQKHSLRVRNTPWEDPGIPDPVCVSTPSLDERPFKQADATRYIQEFCSTSKYWDITLVPQISYGTGLTDSGSRKALSVDNLKGNAPTPPDGIWMQVGFSDSGCIGSFKFGQGKTPEEKTRHCIGRLSKILNNCNTDTVEKKYGGTLTDGCAFYQLTARAPNVKAVFAPRPGGKLLCVDT